MALGGPENPFRFNLPTHAEDFVGRHALVADIARDLANRNGDSYAVIGGRRFGKSSLLAALEEALCRRLGEQEPSGLVVVPVRLSLQEMLPLASADAFFGHALRHVYLALEMAADRGLSIEGSRLLQRSGEIESATLRQFEAGVREVVNAASPLSLRIALLLDEFDSALDSAAAGPLFGNLRALVSTGRVCDRVRLVVAGTGRFREIDGRDSPLVNVLQICFLEAFDDVSSRALIGRAGGLDERVVERLIRATGGHPFILQFILHHLFAEGVEAASTASLEEKVSLFLRERRPDLEGWWRAVGPEGQASYAVLARSSAFTPLEEITRAVGSAKLRVWRGLESLCAHGLVHHRGHRAYGIGCGAFHEFFVQQGDAQSPPAAGPMQRPGYLAHACILELHAAAIRLDLLSSRDVLLGGIEPAVAEQLRQADTLSGQVLSDLVALNRIERLRTGEMPIEIWLMNAVALRGERALGDVFHRALAAVRAP